jgi:hypothetical protein
MLHMIIKIPTFPDMKSDFSISNMIFAMKINIVIEAKITTGYATHYKLKLKQCAKYSYHITWLGASIIVDAQLAASRQSNKNDSLSM